jgi:hypothetical protein
LSLGLALVALIGLPATAGYAADPEGDYNLSGALDEADLNLQAIQIQSSTPDLSYDLNGDDLVNFDDRTHWLHVLRGTWVGDADLSGEFTSGDLITMLVAGKYETGNPATWSEGDSNGDGTFNSSDLVADLGDGGYERGPYPGVSAVPEPSSIVLCLSGFLGFLMLPRKHH